MRRDAARLTDIIKAADAVAGYLRVTSKDRFLTSGMEQDAIIRQLMVVGEAA